MQPTRRLRHNPVGEEDRIHIHDCTAYTADNDASRSGHANIQICAIFTSWKVAVTETSGMFTKIARQTRACQILIRRYLRKLDDQLKVTLFLKMQVVKAESIEDLLYECSRQDYSQGKLL